MYRLMIVDDDENILNALRRLLRGTPCSHGDVVYPLEVETFNSAKEAFERLKAVPFALVMSDFRMPGTDGVTFLKTVREVQPNAVRMILSGFTDLNGLVGAINEAQIARFIAKPWNDYELVSAIAQALAYRDLLLENQRLADERRVQRGEMTPEGLALARLRESRPDLTHFNWGPDGSALFDEGIVD